MKILNFSIITNILPQTCLLCDKKFYAMRKRKNSKINLCDDCIDLLPKKSLKSNNNLKHFSDVLYNNIIVPFVYDMPIDYFILQLKFHNKLIYANLLGTLLADYLCEYYAKHNLTYPQIIVPIPLHKKRLQERGFNQSVEIAKPVSKRFGIQIDRYTCQRSKNTQQQSLLSASQRKDNIKNAFYIAEKNIYKLQNKHIAILDDVITTGNTICEFCKYLNSIGVSNIDVWSVAQRS